MSSYRDSLDWSRVEPLIRSVARAGEATRTFLRLDPERQSAVVNAILAEAAEKGPTSINIKEVARRAGVSVGSLYQYFGSRDGLIRFTVTLCVRYTEGLFEEFGPTLAAMPLAEGLRTYVLGGIEWGETERGLVKFFGRAAYSGNPEMITSVVRPVAEVILGVTREMVSRAAARGELRSDLDLEAATRVVNLLLIAIGDSQLFGYLNNYFRVTDDAMTLERILESALSLLADGMGQHDV